MADGADGDDGDEDDEDDEDGGNNGDDEDDEVFIFETYVMEHIPSLMMVGGHECTWPLTINKIWDSMGGRVQTGFELEIPKSLHIVSIYFSCDSEKVFKSKLLEKSIRKN